MRIERKTLISPKIIKWFYGLVILFTVLVLFVRIAQMTIGPELGKYGRLNKPIVETLSKLPKELTTNAILRTNDYFLGPHLLSNYSNQIIIGGKKFNASSLSNPNKCLWLWDDDDDYTKPEIKNTLKTGALITHVAEFQYTLFYVLSPIEECRR